MKINYEVLREAVIYCAVYNYQHLKVTHIITPEGIEQIMRNANLNMLEIDPDCPSREMVTETNVFLNRFVV